MKQTQRHELEARGYPKLGRYKRRGTLDTDPDRNRLMAAYRQKVQSGR
jgi:hypothetical protein